MNNLQIKERIFMKIERINSNNKKVHVTVAAMFFNEDKVLIIQKADPAYKKKYSIVAGHVEEGESIEDALLREVEEETGLYISQYTLMESFHELNDSCRYGVDLHDWHVYKIEHEIDIDKIDFDKEEIIALHWVPLSELPAMKDFFTSGSKSMFTALGLF